MKRCSLMHRSPHSLISLTHQPCVAPLAPNGAHAPILETLWVSRTSFAPGGARPLFLRTIAFPWNVVLRIVAPRDLSVLELLSPGKSFLPHLRLRLPRAIDRLPHPADITPANLHLHPFKHPAVEHPGWGSCSTDPSFAPVYSALQPAIQLNGRCSNALSGFHPPGCRIVGSLPAFRISHTHAPAPIPAPVPGTVCVFCCNLVLSERRISLSVQVMLDPAPFPAV